MKAILYTSIPYLEAYMEESIRVANTSPRLIRKKKKKTLLLIEATADRLEGQLIFGTLPGWWLGEEPERQMSPNAPLEMWKRILSEVGFTGVDFDVPDYEEPDFQSARVMLSRATTTVQCPFSIVVPASQQPSGEQTAWLRDVSDAIASFTGKSPSIVSLEDVESWPDTICIFTAEMEAPFVDRMDETAFHQLKKLLNQSSGLVCLAAVASSMHQSLPLARLMV